MNRRRIKVLARIALAGGALCALALSTSAGASDSAASIAELEDRIFELKHQAQFADAAELASQLLRYIRNDPTASPSEVVDAQWLLKTVEAAAALPEDARRELARVDSLQAIVDLTWEDGRYDVGMAAAEERLGILRTHLGPEHPEIARSLDDVGGFLDELGESERGEELCAQALEIRRGLIGDNHPLVAESTNNLAHFAQARGDYSEAARLAGQAVDMYRAAFGGDHTDLATAIGNHALFLQLSGDVSAAESLFRESIEMDRRVLGPGSPKVATVLDNLAVLLMDRGDYAAAEPLYREALALRRRSLGDEHPYLALGLSNLGVLLHEQGDYDGAEELFLEALTMRRKLLGEDHPGVAATLNNIATVYSERGDSEEAERLARDALERLTVLLGRDHPRTALALNNLGCALGDQREYAEAEALFHEALVIRRDTYGDEHPDVAASLRNEAQIIAESGDRARALPLYREALDIYRRTLGEGHRDVVRSLQRFGEILLAEGDYQGAESSFAEAASVYDAARLRAGTGYARSTFFASPYESLAGARLLLGKEKDAWPAAERALGRSLADLLMVAERRELSPRERTREDSLKEALGSLERELSAYRAAAREDTAGEAGTRAEKTLNRLLATEAEWSAFQREVSAAHPVTEGETFDLGRVQECLSDETALIGWLDVELLGTERHAWGYVVRHSGPVVWLRLAPAEGELSAFERSRAFRKNLADPGSPELVVSREGGALWGERIKPLSPVLEGVTKIVVIPSGAMLGIPVEALLDPEGSALGERYAVSYAPSATIHTWLAEEGERRSEREIGRALLVGDPPFSEIQVAAAAGPTEDGQTTTRVGGAAPDATAMRGALSGNDEALALLPRLAGTRDEILTIGELFSDAEVLLGQEASEERLVELGVSSDLGGFDTIHFATHALVDNDRAGRSALILSQVGLPDPLEAALAGVRIYDGMVTAEEVVREWELNADMVTLSACETGLGEEVSGEGYIGFAHAFLQAGARSLVVSLWKVEDEATSLLMRRFYENWLGEYVDDRGGRAGEAMNKAEALREAKSWVRSYVDESGGRPYEHPYFWSAFVLIGDPN